MLKTIINAIVKKFFLAWDPGFTKLTARERRQIEQSESEMQRGDYVTEAEVWS